MGEITQKIMGEITQKIKLTEKEKEKARTDILDVMDADFDAVFIINAKVTKDGNVKANNLINGSPVVLAVCFYDFMEKDERFANMIFKLVDQYEENHK